MLGGAALTTLLLVAAAKDNGVARNGEADSKNSATIATLAEIATSLRDLLNGVTFLPELLLLLLALDCICRAKEKAT